jgi:flagellin-like protein
VPRLSTDRAVTPLVGTVLLVAVCVALAGTVGLAIQATSTPDTPPRVRFEVTADARGRIALTHMGGDSLDVNGMQVRVRVDGTPLDHQPPVPFFASRGFGSGPTGPFNSRSPDEWSTGERASFRVAATNDPRIDPGSRVEVSVYANDHRIWHSVATATTTAPAVSRPRPRRHHRPWRRPTRVRGRRS